MASANVAAESFALSEQLLEDMEMGRSSLASVALKASRLARLIGNFDVQEVMLCEANGYPASGGKKTSEAWQLARIAGRTYEVTAEDKTLTYAQWDTIEQLELEIEVLKARIPGLVGIHLSSGSRELKEKVQELGKRRSYIHSFVSRTYFELKFSAVASDVFERTRVKVDKNVGELVPMAVKKFTAVYDNLLSVNNEDWSNAVHSCRRILQDTADALYPARANKIVNPGPKQKEIKLGSDNYINRLIAYVEENSTSTRFEAIVGSHIKYLGERLDSIFQAAQKGSHDVITSQEEADRYVIYTYLVIGDVLQLRCEVGDMAPYTED